MNARTYRFFRILIGGLVLVSCALVFADIGRSLGVGQIRTILWPQFVPSLSALLTGGGWLATGCIAVILLTLVFGRVYCTMLCPLGVLMDFSAWLARRTGRKRKLPYRRGRPWLRSAMVAVCVIGLTAGTAVPLAFLDPFSLFGKITGGTLRPALGTANELLAATEWINPVKVSPVAWTTTGVALGLLLLVVLAAVFRGRWWCNTVCPVGAVLGLFSKHAWLRLQIADSACIGCSMCERVCPAQCIDFRNHTIDHSRCVMCLDCVTSCTRSGIHLKTRRLSGNASGANATLPKSPAVSGGARKAPASWPGHQAGAVNLKRRDILAGIVVLPTAALAGQQPEHAAHQHRRAVLPPGAGSLARFQNLCTACQLCVTNCPDQVLRPSITRHGLAGFLQPYQDFDVSFCSFNCSNCSQVCPTGAISPITVEERRLVRTGLVEFIPDLCIVKTEGTACGACNEHCPTQAVRMVPWKNNLTIPEIEPDLCIGCGGCEFICPVRPHRAIIVNGLPVHERAKPLDLGHENIVRDIEEDFPF
jgi:polyferredoxin